MINGANLLVKTVTAIQSNQYPQNEQTSPQLQGTELRNAPKIFKETCKINWAEDIDKTYNFIRGLSPYPTAWTVLQNQQNSETILAKIFDTEKERVTHNLPAGSVVSDEKDYLKVAVNHGFLSIKNIQVEGKKRLSVQEFLRGFKNIRSFRFV